MCEQGVKNQQDAARTFKTNQRVSFPVDTEPRKTKIGTAKREETESLSFFAPLSFLFAPQPTRTPPPFPYLGGHFILRPLRLHGAVGPGVAEASRGRLIRLARDDVPLGLLPVLLEAEVKSEPEGRRAQDRARRDHAAPGDLVSLALASPQVPRVGGGDAGAILDVSHVSSICAPCF